MGLFIVEFKLNTRSPITVENGDVIVDKGYATVTVRNVHADSNAEAIDKARPKADNFLNELCLQLDINLEIVGGLVVAPQDSPATRHLPGYTIKITATGRRRKKHPTKLKELVIKPSDAKAYYRKAEISEDTFDKFRNLYLAIENVASKIAAAKGMGKLRERQLLEVALQQCFSPDLLKKHLSIYGFDQEGEPIIQVATLLYAGNRCQLNHSKSSEDKKMPFNPNDERTVQRVLPLAKFVAKSLLAYEDAHL